MLRVEDGDGNLKAVLFGYACHATTLGFQQLCGDYPGFAQQYIQEAHPGAIALFMNGCSGDQNPYPRRTLELAEQHGRVLANGVETALETKNFRTLAGPLRVALDYATLKFAGPPSREQIEAEVASSNKYERFSRSSFAGGAGAERENRNGIQFLSHSSRAVRKRSDPGGDLRRSGGRLCPAVEAGACRRQIRTLFGWRGIQTTCSVTCPVPGS